MAKLSYKTNGMMSPQGKQKIYFCSHPEDFELYFESISDEIFKETDIDCVIWFNSDIESGYDDVFWDNLLEMNLFIVPVTRRFLCTQNNALEMEFRFAIDHHIPVLPLMQDSGLINIFNEKCGELQFLDKYQFDITAISYEEKLKKYLRSVLIDDTVTEKIRSSFDAYAFLSYRKMDRKYAQELMKLIHKNSFCRDIAIWYDEFLVPGENFNYAIENALKKSDLFVMTVTPNLLTMDNYVMTAEYPLAKKNSKPILPIECISTDKVMLSNRYQHIPECIDVNNKKELSKVLFDVVKQIGIKEKDVSPEHNFLIGLAYLNGIDVEIDFPRAVKLITSSAESGVDAAIQKLVSMYQNGEGVERNYELAIEWKNRLFFVFKERYEISKKKEDAIALLYVFKELNELYFNYMRWSEEIIFLLEDFCSLAEEFVAKFGDPIFRHMLAVGYYQRGKYWSSEEEDAKNDFLKAHELNLALEKERGTLDAKIALCLSSVQLGDISFDEDDTQTAKDYYQKALEIAKDIIEVSSTDGIRKVFALCHSRFGKMCKIEGEINQAIEIYQKAINILQQLAEKSESSEIRKELMTCYVQLAEIELKEEKYSSAKILFEQACQLGKMIDVISETIQSKEYYANCCEHLYKIHMIEGNENLAKDYYHKAQKKKGEIVEAIGDAEEKEMLSIRYIRLGNECVEENKRDLALAYYFRAVNVLEELSMFYESLCRRCVAQGNELQASNYFNMWRQRIFTAYQKYIDLLQQGNEQEISTATFYENKMQKLLNTQFD